MKVVDDKVRRVESLTIQFNSEELDFLAGVMAKIGGCPHNSPRKFQESLYKILEGCGYTYENSEAFKLLSGSIDCKGYK